MRLFFALWLSLISAVSSFAENDSAGLVFWSTHVDWLDSEIEVLNAVVKSSPFSKFEFIDRLNPKKVSDRASLSRAIQKAARRLRSKNLVIYINSHGLNGFIEGSDNKGRPLHFKNRDLVGAIERGLEGVRDVNLLLFADYCFPRSIQPELLEWVNSESASKYLKSVHVFFPGTSYQTIDSDQNPSILQQIRSWAVELKDEANLDRRLFKYSMAYQETASSWGGGVWKWKRGPKGSKQNVSKQAEVLLQQFKTRLRLGGRDYNTTGKQQGRLIQTIQAMGHLGVHAYSSWPFLLDAFRTVADRSIRGVLANALGEILRGEPDELPALNALDVACSYEQIKTACGALVRVVYSDSFHSKEVRSWLKGPMTLKTFEEFEKTLVIK